MQNYRNHQVDLTNCDTEPIHLIGRIQPHGFLLVLDKATLVVEQISANVSHFFGDSPESLLGEPLAALVTAEEFSGLAQYFPRE